MYSRVAKTYNILLFEDYLSLLSSQTAPVNSIEWTFGKSHRLIIQIYFIDPEGN